MRIDVSRAFLPPLTEYVAQLEDIWETRWLTNNGPKLKALESALCEKLGLPYLVMCSNGTIALTLALMSLEKKGEVITTPFTFAATAAAIVAAGCKPVFADIDPKRLTLDPGKVAELINANTVAIMPVCVYGIPGDQEALSAIGSEYSLPIIYDAAHCFGAENNDVSILNSGDIACFSLHATKLYHTVEGGGIVCRDEDTYKKLYHLSNFGITSQTSINLQGINGKMSEFHAAMGLSLLPYLDQFINQRADVYARYEALLQPVRGVTLLSEYFPDKHNYAYCPVLFEGGDKAVALVIEELNKESIFPRRYFYPSLSRSGAYTNSRADTPIADRVSLSALCLPIYPELPLDVVDGICGTIRDALKGS